MIGRADIEGSKSNVALNAWLPQASYPCNILAMAIYCEVGFNNIPVVTFLAPLALNFKGLKDR